ncbi:MAG: hypothetical protein KF816_17195 [Melioribacteraceae bacterium]|nr:hypothetical protein [Melioribacteraceae bacterium]
MNYSLFLLALSFKVLGWQIFLGGVQFVGKKLFNNTGLVIGYLFVLFFTLNKTYNDLFTFQIIVQTLVFISILFWTKRK